MNENSRVKAVIHMDAVRYNFEAMRRNLKEGVKITAVIKADAYGHGAVPIAQMMEKAEYIWGFAVATAEEAIQLRQSGIRKPILILGLVFEESMEALAAQDVRIAVSSLDCALAYAQAGLKLGKKVKIHLAVDTGMSRIGFDYHSPAMEEIRQISALPGLEIEGMFTHFARADETDISPARLQLDRFLHFASLLEKEDIHIPLKHCSNSAGIIRFPQAQLDMVRAGITIYGIYPSSEVERDLLPLKPVMELKSRISYLKTIKTGDAVSYGGTYVASHPVRLATIPVGYADGYPRLLSNKGWVLIHGKKAPICGRVCMDQFMVDVSGIENVKIGDEVTLMGKDGEAFLAVDTLGELSGRFPYEFVCDISKRVPRVYLYDEEKTI
ncbi:MAG: alanine racemase [Blautia sp.]|nr:alanine racemase [Blautia sp.]